MSEENELINIIFLYQLCIIYLKLLFSFIVVYKTFSNCPHYFFFVNTGRFRHTANK